MIKTRLFQDEYCNGEWIEIDRLINGFLRSESIQVVDIKYNSFNTGRTHNTALLIYKEEF